MNNLDIKEEIKKHITPKTLVAAREVMVYREQDQDDNQEPTDSNNDIDFNPDYLVKKVSEYQGIVDSIDFGNGPYKFLNQQTSIDFLLKLIVFNHEYNGSRVNYQFMHELLSTVVKNINPIMPTANFSKENLQALNTFGFEIDDDYVHINLDSIVSMNLSKDFFDDEQCDNSQSIKQSKKEDVTFEIFNNIIGSLKESLKIVLVSTPNKEGVNKSDLIDFLNSSSIPILENSFLTETEKHLKSELKNYFSEDEEQE
ncbi:hypothetical protein SAMN05518863_10762 [Candidatus Pantoea symbiotica]|uniref:Uncharacterized protein n=1 Tax=Candidatus Pantoea symbiotica TaxID=1884370 RepID=A0A1I3ZJX7_9GAMM|nr:MULTISPECIES: hypothetical protein [Pantoea]KAJ9430018.1 hypothetical protein PMI39_020800 [Pantoea sp. YR343]MRT26949.1 hypothetical protein [Enterobacteriaceae bacterium RIT697]SFK44354.1 hypothetical protein SAMN05518863_10762 [Pantoea symbiotica]SFU93275.1 hypothetical protein SAMN05518864_107263 [Pantoea sp. YR525]